MAHVTPSEAIEHMLLMGNLKKIVMERNKLLEEYKAALESLVEKTKFCYSEEFYQLDDFEKQKYQKDRMATEGHLSTLCSLLWGEKIQSCGGISDIFALSVISSIFNGGGFPPLPKFEEKEPGSQKFQAAE